MIISTPAYQTAIDRINTILESDKISNNLRKQLRNEVIGLVAEKQVAYHLTTYFRDSDEIFVYNNFAFQDDQFKRQIDHLVFSRRAFYLIESKSIAGTIWVNGEGEFHRQYGRNKKSIKSPIEQVKTQETAFINLLKANKEKLLGKVLCMQKSFNSWTPKHFVAISEKGTIKRSGKEKFKELMKFDQIASTIAEHHKKTDIGLLKSIDDESRESFNLLNKKEIERIINFLEASDISQEPLEKIEELISHSKPHSTIYPSEKFSCEKCGSSNLQIVFGKNYYFKCNDCNGNTPIKLICKKCSGPMRTRKQKNKFYKVCKKCGIDELYFVNKIETLEN